jgi:hypothetical protein
MAAVFYFPFPAGKQKTNPEYNLKSILSRLSIRPMLQSNSATEYLG